MTPAAKSLYRSICLDDYSTFCCGACIVNYINGDDQHLPYQRLNPKSLTRGKSRLWHRVKVDSGIGLAMENVLESTLEWT